MIPFKKINITEDEISAVARVMRSGMIGLGNDVFEFEKMLADYMGSKYAIAVDSCTSALFLSLKYFKEVDLKGKDRVAIIPSMTVPLVAAAIIEAGYQMEFSDDTNWVGSAYPILNTNVWDSAHQLEKRQFQTMKTNKKIDGNAKVCVSFYPTKNIGSADGGAILTDDEQFADWARSISCYGRNQSNKYQNSWDYDIELIGYKRHWTNLQAVIATEQLKRLDKINERREGIRDHYNTEFKLKNSSLYLYRLNVGIPSGGDFATNSYLRNRFIEKMRSKNIECGVHFKPLHLMAAYKGFKFNKGGLSDPLKDPVAKVNLAYSKTVSIPFYNQLTDEETERIIDAVRECMP